MALEAERLLTHLSPIFTDVRETMTGQPEWWLVCQIESLKGEIEEVVTSALWGMAEAMELSAEERKDMNREEWLPDGWGLEEEDRQWYKASEAWQGRR